MVSDDRSNAGHETHPWHQEDFAFYRVHQRSDAGISKWWKDRDDPVIFESLQCQFRVVKDALQSCV